MIDFQSLDLNLLRVFDVIMQERSFTKAAQRLQLTQPAVSNALRRLREALGDELLVRAGQSIVPTARAVELWPTIREAMSRLSDMLAPEMFEVARSDMSFRVGMMDAAATLLLPRLIQIMEKEAPHVTLRVLPLTTLDPRPLLKTSEVDVAVGYFPSVLADLSAYAHMDERTSLRAHTLYQREYMCAMSIDNPLAHTELTLEQYTQASHVMMSISGGDHSFVDEALAARGLRRHVVMTVNHYLTAARVAAQSQLLTWLPRNFLEPGSDMTARLTLQKLPIAVPSVNVSMLWLRHNRYPVAIHWLLNALQRCAGTSTTPIAF